MALRAVLHLALEPCLERAAHLACDDDAVRGGERLAGDAHIGRIDTRLRALTEEEIDDLVRDAVADLVGMAFETNSLVKT